MKVEILPIDFLGQGALLEPADAKLHDLVVEYCARELEGGDKLNLARFQKVWVAVETDEHGKPSICGIAGFVWRVDIPVFRVTGDKPDRVTHFLHSRIRSYFQDQGLRGQEVFLHISSKERPEQRCAKWQEALAASGAEPADRFSLKV